MVIDVEGFFVEDEKEFKKEDIARLINKLKPHAKLIGKEGKVHIENRSLSDTDKSKTFLVARYLGAELAKARPELGINEEIATVTSKEFAEFLRVNSANARARISQLVTEGFAKKIGPGNIAIQPFQAERFLDQLEDKSINKTAATKRVKAKTQKPKAIPDERQVEPAISEKEFFDNLKNFLKVDSTKLKDIIFYRGTNDFKFNEMAGSSKTARQRNCMLCAGYVLYFGLQKKTFSTKDVMDICLHSGIDSAGLPYTIRDMKKANLINKAGRRSQENILREEGKKEAEEILKGLCEGEH